MISEKILSEIINVKNRNDFKPFFSRLVFVLGESHHLTDMITHATCIVSFLKMKTSLKTAFEMNGYQIFKD